MKMVIRVISWCASGSLIAYATITQTSAFYLLVFIPIAITFEYAMKTEPVNHKPQKHRLPHSTLLAFIIIGSLLAAAGYFRNPKKRHIFIILYVVGMVVLLVYGCMASKMAKSLDKTAEIDAIIWLLRLETSPNPDLLEKALRRIVSRTSGADGPSADNPSGPDGPSGPDSPCGPDYRPKILESLMPLLSRLIVSHDPDVEPVKDLETYVSCLAYLADFKNQRGSWWLLMEDARSHPALEERLQCRLKELAKHQTRVGMAAREVLRLFGLKDQQQTPEDASSIMTFVESAHSYEEMELHSRHKGGYYSVA